MTHPEILKLEKGIEECLLIPQDLLPESYRTKRSHRPLKSIVREGRKKGKIETEHQELKRLKKENIAKYSREFEEKGSFEYNVNDDKLFRNQMTFCTLMGVELDEE